MMASINLLHRFPLSARLGGQFIHKRHNGYSKFGCATEGFDKESY